MGLPRLVLCRDKSTYGPGDTAGPQGCGAERPAYEQLRVRSLVAAFMFNSCKFGRFTFFARGRMPSRI